MLRMWKDYIERTGFLEDSVMCNEKEKAGIYILYSIRIQIL